MFKHRFIDGPWAGQELILLKEQPVFWVSVHGEKLPWKQDRIFIYEISKRTTVSGDPAADFKITYDGPAHMRKDQPAVALKPVKAKASTKPK
jgi:hypothetical protein